MLVICHKMDRISVGTHCLITLQEAKRYIGLLNIKICSKFGGALQPSPMSLKPTQYYIFFHSLFSNNCVHNNYFSVWVYVLCSCIPVNIPLWNLIDLTWLEYESDYLAPRCMQYEEILEDPNGTSLTIKEYFLTTSSSSSAPPPPPSPLHFSHIHTNK